MTTFCNTLNAIVLKDFGNKTKKKCNSRVRSMRTDTDKRIRREIANNNERRRMKSINIGFENLRKIIPYGKGNEKLSKAAILQTTAKYILDLKEKIQNLENELKLMKRIRDDDKFSEKTSNEDVTISSQVLADSFTSELGSSIGSLVTENSASLSSLKSSDDNVSEFTSLNCSINNASHPQKQQPKNLDQLFAAIQEVERLEANQNKTSDDDNDHSYEYTYKKCLNSISKECFLPGNGSNKIVMKPTISPYTEEIIKGAIVSLTYPNSFTNSQLTTVSSSSSSSMSPIITSSSLSIPCQYILKSEISFNRSNH